jgi:hypothetical protein
LVEAAVVAEEVEIEVAVEALEALEAVLVEAVEV